MAKVLMVASSDWMLYNHRLGLAKAMKQLGHDVIIVCPFGKYLPQLREEGFRCINWSLDRGGLNPLTEALSIRHIYHIYQTEKPHIIHQFTIKPNFYGTLAVRLIRYKRKENWVSNLNVINTFTGLGFTFSNCTKATLLRILILPLLKWACQSPNLWTIFQNQSDRSYITRLGLASANRSSIIPGTGVNTNRFHPNKNPREEFKYEGAVVLMACRLLTDKGVGEFVDAARLLCRKKCNAKFLVAGKPDSSNPTSVTETMMRKWRTIGSVDFLGQRNDMSELLRKTDIAVLPSYYNEGVPLFLLEAAASGLPLVGTDIEGCRVIIKDGVNGFLVPARNSTKLAEAIEKLLNDVSLREEMGQKSRTIALSEFDEEKIISKHISLHRQFYS